MRLRLHHHASSLALKVFFLALFGAAIYFCYWWIRRSYRRARAAAAEDEDEGRGPDAPA